MVIYQVIWSEGGLYENRNELSSHVLNMREKDGKTHWGDEFKRLHERHTSTKIIKERNARHGI